MGRYGQPPRLILRVTDDRARLAVGPGDAPALRVFVRSRAEPRWAPLALAVDDRGRVRAPGVGSVERVMNRRRRAQRDRLDTPGGRRAMRVRFHKRPGRADRIEGVRPDGSSFGADVPKKGPVLPHDAVHLVVERALRCERSFWGRVAAGASFAEVGAIARRGGHASASRVRRDPDPDIVELVQTERLVECFEAELWSGAPPDQAQFDGVLAAACAESRVPRPALTAAAMGRIRAELAELAAAWRVLSAGATLELDLPVPGGA